MYGIFHNFLDKSCFYCQAVDRNPFTTRKKCKQRILGQLEEKSLIGSADQLETERKTQMFRSHLEMEIFI